MLHTRVIYDYMTIKLNAALPVLSWDWHKTYNFSIYAEHRNVHVTQRKEKQIAGEVSWSLPTPSWCIGILSDTNYLKLTVEFGVTVQVTIFLSVSDEWVGGVAWRILLTIGFSMYLLQSIFPSSPLSPLLSPCLHLWCEGGIDTTTAIKM